MGVRRGISTHKKISRNWKSRNLYLEARSKYLHKLSKLGLMRVEHSTNKLGGGKFNDWAPTWFLGLHSMNYAYGDWCECTHDTTPTPWTLISSENTINYRTKCNTCHRDVGASFSHWIRWILDYFFGKFSLVASSPQLLTFLFRSFFSIFFPLW